MGQVKRDSILNTIITYSGIGIGYLNKGLLFPLLLLPEQVGLANIILFIVGFFSQFSNLGTGMILLRFLPFMKGREAGYSGILLFSIFILLGGIGLISILLIVFHQPLFDYFSKESALLVDYSFWIIPLGISAAFYSLFEHYLRSISKNVVSVLVQDFVLRIMILFCLVGYYLGFYNFENFIFIFFLLHFVPGLSLFVYLLYLKQFYISSSYLNISRKLRNHMINYGSIVYINSFGRNAILMADTLLLSAISGLKEVGVFTTMVFLSNALFVPYVSLVRISAPHVPKYWRQRNMVALKELYQKVSILGFFITIVLFMFVWINIDFALSFLPNDYSSGKYIFFLLMVGRTFDALGGINGDIILTSKKFKVEIWLTIPLIFVVFIANFILIPVYGGIGAAIVTAGIYIVYNVLRVLFNWKFFRLFPYDRNFLKVFIISMLTFGALLLCQTLFDPITVVFLSPLLIILLLVLPVLKLNLIPEFSRMINGAFQFKKS